MLAMIVQAGLLAVDRVTFSELASCPVCGGAVSGYDTRKKVFAVVRENDHERSLTVSVKRFSCHSCGRIVNADEPFYPGTRIGSPVVDLCLTLATMMPVNRTAAWLDAVDIIVDRTSCREYVQKQVHIVPVHGSFRYPDAAFGNLIVFRLLPGREGQSRPRGRSSRCLWFPIHTPDSV